MANRAYSQMSTVKSLSGESPRVPGERPNRRPKSAVTGAGANRAYDKEPMAVAGAGVAVAVAAPPTVIARRIELLEITVPDGMNADNQVYNQGILLTQLPMRP